MLQVCTRQSDKPYRIAAVDVNVYSLEEISYFLYNHMNLVYREFFCDSLFDYIEKELGEEQVAQGLRMLDRNDASVRDMIMYVLKASSYYSADDLAAVADLLMNINNLSRNERMQIEAGAMMKQKRYGTALHIYLDILSTRDPDNTSNDMFYARIAFSTGVVYAKMFMCRNANTYFSMAYDLYQDPVYAKASVYMSIINNDEEELLRNIIKYKVSDEALAVIKEHIEKARSQIESSSEYLAFESALNEEDGPEKQIAKWKNEYYTMLS